MIFGDEVSHSKMQTTWYTAVVGEMNKTRSGPEVFRKFQAREFIERVPRYYKSNLPPILHKTITSVQQ